MRTKQVGLQLEVPPIIPHFFWLPQGLRCELHVAPWGSSMLNRLCSPTFLHSLWVAY